MVFLYFHKAKSKEIYLEISVKPLGVHVVKQRLQENQKNL